MYLQPVPQPSFKTSPFGLRHYGNPTQVLQDELDQVARLIDPVFWDGMRQANWYYGSCDILRSYDAEYAQQPCEKNPGKRFENVASGVCCSEAQEAIVAEKFILGNGGQSHWPDPVATFFHEQAHSLLFRLAVDPDDECTKAIKSAFRRDWLKISPEIREEYKYFMRPLEAAVEVWAQQALFDFQHDYDRKFLACFPLLNDHMNFFYPSALSGYRLPPEGLYRFDGLGETPVHRLLETSALSLAETAVLIDYAGVDIPNRQGVTVRERFALNGTMWEGAVAKIRREMILDAPKSGHDLRTLPYYSGGKAAAGLIGFHPT